MAMSDHDDDRVIRGFQIGPLGEAECLSITSFLNHGHDYELWSYDLAPAVPQDTWVPPGFPIRRREFPGGTWVRPAETIVPRDVYHACFPTSPDPSDLHQRRRMALFANYFRYRLMHRLGGWWCDMDAIAVRRFATRAPYVFCGLPGEARRGRLINGVFKVPAGADFLRRLADDLEPKIAAGCPDNPDPVANTWEFTAAVLAAGLHPFVMAAPVFAPFAPGADAELAYYEEPAPAIPPWTWALHLYKSMNHGRPAAPGSLYADLVDRHLRANVAYEAIRGHFDFQAIYAQAVAEARDGDVLVEIGAWEGRSTAYLARAIELAGRGLSCVVVDTWAGAPGSGLAALAESCGGSDAMHALFLANLRAAGLAGRVIVCHQESVAAAEQFRPGQVGFVFFDGDHSEAGLAADLAAWYPRVRPGGVLAGHNLEPNYPGVRAAVTSFFAQQGVAWIERGISWWARVPDPAGRFL
jgi:predicted O-methyltransferase YrrM